MSTDIFGARVLGVDPDRREVNFRVFVVYYETSGRIYLPPPGRDRGFFLGLLWESGRWDHPIGEATISVDQILDDDWRAENARWFVEDVECTARRNDPPSAETWEKLHDFYYERAGRWSDEALLVQADYTVRVTHERWMEHLAAGDAWGTTHYPQWADDPRPEDLPHVPDLRNPAVVLDPFPEEEAYALAFSDDGRHLAVMDYAFELVVYEAATWTEIAREGIAADFSDPHLMWVPGRSVVTILDQDTGTQVAYDADARAVTTVPVEEGRAHSPSGRHRLEFGDKYGVRFLGGPTVLGSEDDAIIISGVSFTADESRLFARCDATHTVHTIDPATGAVLDRLDEPCDRLWAMAVSPDGACLATSVRVHGGDTKQEVRIRRVGRPEIVTRHSPGEYVFHLEWSPDGALLAAVVQDGARSRVHLLPVGLPSEPPEALRPPPGAPAKEEGPTPDPNLMHEMARSGDPVTQDELKTIAREHARWVDSGGGFGRFQTLAVGGLVMAVYQGQAGQRGEQALLSHRLLPSDLDLRDVALPWSDLTGIVAESADLTGADLRGATITDSLFTGARLRGVDLRDADLSRSDLRNADLTGADLTGTDLEDADLTGATLTDAKGI